jgi:hypothetical protein
MACDGACIDVMTDPDHCGDCTTMCPTGEPCDAGTCACEGASALSYAANIEPVLAAQCTAAGCHRGPVPQAGLNLTTGNGYAGLVGVASSQCANRMIVAPGQPGASYLVNKLMGTNLCFGTKMPKTGSIGADNIAAINDWICTGANP